MRALQRSRCHVSLVDVQVVPFPCPIDQPPIDKEFSRTSVAVTVKRKRASRPSSSGVHAGLARRLSPGAGAASPSSLLRRRNAGGQRGKQKLARALQKAGHHVMLLPGEVNHVGSVLCRCRDCFFRSDVGLYQGGGTALREDPNGIRNCRNHGGLSLHLSDVCAAPAGTFLRC